MVPDMGYTVYALKLPSYTPAVSGESLQTGWTSRCPGFGIQLLPCWRILAVSSQLLDSNSSVLGCGNLNLVFDYMEVALNR